LKRQHHYPKDYDEKMTWRIRWCFLGAITIIYALMLVGGLVGYWITNDFHCLLLITPTAFTPFMYYLVPMDERKYNLKLAKINANKELQKKISQNKILEAKLHQLQKRTPAK
jgi:hypothetical protein